MDFNPYISISVISNPVTKVSENDRNTVKLLESSRGGNPQTGAHPYMGDAVAHTAHRFMQ